MTTAPEPKTSWRPLVAAWLGWAFDGLDGYLYVMVAIPFVTQLIANEHGVTPDEAKAGMLGLIQSRAALIQAVFLIGWAFGGVAFGRIGDRLGRSRTLTLTILTYAIFTGLSFFATAWWHLMIFRFLAALGIGGEWAAGSALVAETLPRKHRDLASAVLQSGYILGCIAATMSAGWITAHFDVKYVFLVGVLPAFVTLWIRHSVPEPAEWSNAAGSAPAPKIADLFSPQLRRTTILLLIHISIALTVVWAFLFFTPQLIARMDYFKSLTKHDQEALKTRITVAYFSANIAANFIATFLMNKLGPRLAFGILMGLAFLTLCLGFRTQPTIENVYLVTCAYAMTGLGLFGIFPLYVPPLFPTLLRTLGAGLTYNFGRIAAAAGTLVAGELTTAAGGPAQVVFWVGLLYIPGLFVCAMLPKRA
ncbi:MAG: MFS transporter [Phycisphaerales bacterium]